HQGAWRGRARQMVRGGPVLARIWHGSTAVCVSRGRKRPPGWLLPLGRRPARGQKFGLMATALPFPAQPDDRPGRLLDSTKLQSRLSKRLRVLFPAVFPAFGFLMTFRVRPLALLIVCAALFTPHSALAEANAAEISAAKHAFESALVAEAE